MRVAVFVDAGYLFARCSVVLTGSRLPRATVELDQCATMGRLIATANEKAAGSSLLRIYWYDGVLPSGLSKEQRALAGADDVKLRLGVLNVYGQQKGVDSLIVTDLVELARNHAISDAVLLSGDEDVRIGVTIAQSYGVRVHLVGIGSGIESQSRTLMQEVDTRTEWSRDDISTFFSVKVGHQAAHPSQVPSDEASADGETSSALNEVARELVTSLTAVEFREVADLGASNPVPREYDIKLLGESRTRLGRHLIEGEKHYLRGRFKHFARDAAGTP